MHDTHEDLLFSDDLSPDQREVLRQALLEDPALADVFTQWHRLRASLRERLEAVLPDRQVLVLYALEAAGRGDLLSASEQQTLDRARPGLERALEAYPALSDVLFNIKNACADFDAAWEAQTTPAAAAPRRRRVDREARRPARRHAGQRWGWRVMASIALVAFAALLLLLVQRDQQRVTVEVAQNEMRSIELADGSTVRLLGGSSLTYTDPSEESAFSRHVELTGRAFFDVVPAQQGFTVETPTALTTVLGTTFGIQADEEAMNVILATGRISVASKAARDQVVVLEPGQSTRVARNALPSSPTSVEIDEALAWTGLFFFDDTSIGDVVARLSAHYGVAVAADPTFQEEVLARGTFAPEQPLTEILTALARTLDATVQEDATGGYLLVPAM